MPSCQHCGVPVSKDGKRGPAPKYCSDLCRNRAKWLRQKAANPCPGCGEPMARSSSSSADDQLCRKCRFGGGEHGTSAMYNSGRCRCQPCKDAKAKEMRGYAARRKAAGRPIDYRAGRKRVSLTCGECSVEFSAEAGRNQRFCSSACANANQTSDRAVNQRARERQREFGKQGTVRWRALKRARDAASLGGGARVFVQGPCSVCGDDFLAPGEAARYCSDACRSEVREVPFKISKLARLRIYEAAGWACELCDAPTRPGEHHNHPRYPTLDHIQPRSLGGSDDPENLRLACRQCNIQRGANVDWVPELVEVRDDSSREVA